MLRQRGAVFDARARAVAHGAGAEGRADPRRSTGYPDDREPRVRDAAGRRAPGRWRRDPGAPSRRAARPVVPRRRSLRMTAPPPPPGTPSPLLLRLPGGTWAAPIVQALRAGALVVHAEAGVLELSGSGAVVCMQGLLTSDFEKPGDGAFMYGALLTPKGMIVVDGWASRIGSTVRYTVPETGREPALGILTRSVPPRLARTGDRSGELAVVRLAGAHALAIAEAA